MIRKMTVGYVFLLVMVFSIALADAQGNNSCCYGNVMDIKNGQVIDSYPTKCMQLLCHQGRTEPRYFDKPEDCGCCVYKGRMYRNGERIEGVCIGMTCRDGRWVTEGYIDECCEICYFHNDPHIVTFDGYYYDWHGTCNYSISQPNFGYNERFGIYGQYTQCNGMASCVDVTTFKDNPNTVIEVTHSMGPNVLVNNNAYIVQGNVESLPVGDPYQPVLTWTDGNCNWFLGSQGLLLATCPGQIYVWAYPNLVNQLNGLCGHLNLYTPDDFTDRTGFPETLQTYPYTFPVSWLTADQTRPGCDPTVPVTNPPTVGPPTGPCKLNEDDKARLKGVCTNLFLNVNWQDQKCSKITINIAIRSCISDLCLMEQNGATSTEIEAWKIRMTIMLEIRIEICEHTTEDGLPPPPPKKECCKKGGCGCGLKAEAKIIIKA